jgi:cell division transport system ATP-binding protein
MITLSHINHSYETEDGIIEVFNDLNAQIEDEEFVFLTGKSGSGKTTIIKMILNDITPLSGNIIVDGQNLRDLPRRKKPYYRRSIGVLFQDFKLIQEVSIYDNLLAAILATGGSIKDAENKISYVLSMLGIDHLHKRFPKELSGGEQQKVCLARAVINHPKILLVDEPTGNLDPTSSAEIMRLLDIIHRQKITVVMATHDQTVINNSKRRILDLDEIKDLEA